jgi:hypothetical protein
MATRLPSRLFDHLVGAREQRWGSFEAERLGCREVDDKIELGRLLDWDALGLVPRKILST